MQPIAVKPVTAEKATFENKPVGAVISQVGSEYKTMTKYSYSESGEKYVKVLLDFPDAKNLIKKE